MGRASNQKKVRAYSPLCQVGVLRGRFSRRRFQVRTADQVLCGSQGESAGRGSFWATSMPATLGCFVSRAEMSAASSTVEPWRTLRTIAPLARAGEQAAVEQFIRVSACRDQRNEHVTFFQQVSGGLLSHYREPERSPAEFAIPVTSFDFQDRVVGSPVLPMWDKSDSSTVLTKGSFRDEDTNDRRRSPDTSASPDAPRSSRAFNRRPRPTPQKTSCRA